MTPGPVERKFFEVRYDKVCGDSLFIAGKLYYDGSIDWQDVKGWEDDISKAHESAIAEAVKEAVERCAKIAELRMHSILNPAYLQPERKHSDDIAFGEIKSARTIAAEIRAQAQGATHG